MAEIDYRARKYHVARQIYINKCIESGVWEDRAHFKTWLFAEFGTESTKKLNKVQLKVLWIYLRFYAGEIPRPDFGAQYPWRISPKQLWRVKELVKALTWSEDHLNKFIQKQLGVSSFANALSKEAATKLITGLDKIYTHNLRKINND